MNPSPIPIIGPALKYVGDHPTPILFFGLGTLLAIVALQGWFFWRTRQRLAADVSKWRSLCAALKPYALAASGDPPRLVLSRPFGEVVDEWLHDEWESGWFSRLGSAYTSVALTFTFLLIAAVLDAEVGPAIVNNSMSQLSLAVSSMGAKFIISFTGAFLGVAADHFFFQGLCRAAIHQHKRVAMDAQGTNVIEYQLGGGAGGAGGGVVGGGGGGGAGGGGAGGGGAGGGGGGGEPIVDVAALARLKAAIKAAGGRD